MPNVLEKYQTFWRRLFAFTIDGVIITIITTMVEYGVIVSQITQGTPYGTMGMSISILDQALAYLYLIWMTGKYGQTIGKVAAGVKVLDKETEGHAIGFLRAVYRELPLLILSLIGTIYAITVYTDDSATSADSMSFATSWMELMMYFLVIWVVASIVTMFTNDKRRTVHDFLARSVVVKVTNQKELPIPI